jgi:tryptophan synthase beta subunit
MLQGHARRERSSIHSPHNQLAYQAVGAANLYLNDSVFCNGQRQLNGAHALKPLRERNREREIAPAINISHAADETSHVVNIH